MRVRGLACASGCAPVAVPLLVALGLLPTVSIHLSAQTTDHSITCTVLDTSGRPLSDLPVEVDSVTPPREHARSFTGYDGSVTFNGLREELYAITVAGGILLPAKPFGFGTDPTQVLTLQLPISVSPSHDRTDDVVSLQQLSVPPRVERMMRQALEAWFHNDVTRSRTLAERTLQLRPDFGPAVTLIGILQVQEGHHAEGITILLQGLRNDPDSPRGYLALASAYNQLRQNNQALDALSLLAKLAPESWQLHYETGRAYLGQQRYQSALAEFNRALMLDEQNSEVIHLGRAHALLGLKDYSTARAELKIVITNSPNGPYTEEAHQLAAVLDTQLKKADTPVEAVTRIPVEPETEH